MLRVLRPHLPTKAVLLVTSEDETPLSDRIPGFVRTVRQAPVHRFPGWIVTDRLAPTEVATVEETLDSFVRTYQGETVIHLLHEENGAMEKLARRVPEHIWVNTATMTTSYSREPVDTCVGRGSAETHCCYVEGEVCKFLRKNVAGRKFACELMLELGSWDLVHEDPRYQPVRAAWERLNVPLCGDWEPTEGECCRAAI